MITNQYDFITILLYIYIVMICRRANGNAAIFKHWLAAGNLFVVYVNTPGNWCRSWASSILVDFFEYNNMKNMVENRPWGLVENLGFKCSKWFMLSVMPFNLTFNEMIGFSLNFWFHFHWYCDWIKWHQNLVCNESSVLS